MMIVFLKQFDDGNGYVSELDYLNVMQNKAELQLRLILSPVLIVLNKLM